MQFKTLTNTPLPEIVRCFNRSFSDYMVPVQLSNADLERKLKSDRIQLEHSVGAFDGDQLVGFILHGIDQLADVLTAYNAGTGVLPDYRGQRYTQQMYDYILPQLKKNGVQQCLLEVITTNQVAIKVYQQAGFHQTRAFDCFKGVVAIVNDHFPLGYHISVVDELPWDQLPAFWNYQPSWQNDTEGIRAIWGDLVGLGIFHGGELVGYGICNSDSGRVMQFGILPDYRGQKLGHYLFFQMGRIHNPKLTVINIDRSDTQSLEALQAIGLQSFIRQYEMKMLI